MVECHLAKVEVAGPNPVSRSKKNDKHIKCLSFFFWGGIRDRTLHNNIKINNNEVSNISYFVIK